MSKRIDEILERYKDLCESNLDRLERALNETRLRRYTPTALISDTLQGWLDAVEWWRIPLELLSTDRCEPLLEMTIKSSGDSAQLVVPFVLRESSATLEIPNLIRTGGGGQIHQTKTHAAWSSDLKVLMVQIDDLEGQSPPGIYTGSIRTAGEQAVVARLIVFVKPA